MKPPKNSNTYEKVKCGEFLLGTIDKIDYDMEHVFKGFQGGEDKKQPGIRFVVKLQGYEYPHRSRWMKFSLHEKSNLFKKYVSKLINNAHPDMDVDLDILIGMGIKTVWEENGEFQNIELIAPVGKKKDVPENNFEEPPLPDDDFIPEIEENDVPL